MNDVTPEPNTRAHQCRQHLAPLGAWPSPAPAAAEEKAAPPVQEALQLPDAGRPALANVVPMLRSGQRAVSRQNAGDMLGVSWKTVERLIDRGELRAFKVLGQWRIFVSDIDLYVARQIGEQKKRLGA